MIDRSPLSQRLAAAIPDTVNFSCYHVSTKPTPSSALFAPFPSQPEEPTTCESHFLAVSSPANRDQKEILIYAIEILIFTTPSLTFLFVSKADSSGFSSHLNAPKNSPSVVTTVTAIFVDFLLEPRLEKSRVVLSLFARAQNQYLFPGSVDNQGKHVLDDRQLIKWWSRVLDRVLRLHTNGPSESSQVTAHLVVPGCDKAETKAFFPPSARTDSPTNPKWINSYPVDLLVADSTKPPRSIIPRLPDDPKSRFLDDLDSDFLDEQGRWRSVKNLDQFWEMMSYRQECSAGRLVGFLWVVFSQGRTGHVSLKNLEQSCHLAQPHLITPANSQRHENGGIEPLPLSKSDLTLIGQMDSPPPSSPFEDIRVSLPSGDENVQASGVSTSRSESALEARHVYIDLPQGEIAMDREQYETLMDYLLQTDFSGEELAVENSRGWINKALEISGASTFGYLVRGQLTLVESLQPVPEKASLQPINMLTSVRKKRKAEHEDPTATRSEVVQSFPAASVNTLSAGLVRKKPKS